tara:strand:- start:1663 stop:1932 length:270 start_codon:yes stop_codon:yes gene_type:complete
MHNFKIYEARVAPSPETGKKISQPLNRAAGATLKRSLNLSVDGLEALAWKLEHQYQGVDPKAIADLKNYYKQGLKLQKNVSKAIDKAKN